MDQSQHWQKHCKLWQVRFPWLICSQDAKGRVLGIGCAVCASGDTGSVWAQNKVTGQSMQPSCMKKHASSKEHKALEKRLADEFSTVAPSEGDFAQVMEAVWTGRAETDACGRWKLRKMLWCLAEAQRNRLRAAISGAASMSIQQDVRDGLLAVTFTCCDLELSSSSGVLGHANLYEFGQKSKNIYDATVYVIHKFATQGAGIPFVGDEGGEVGWKVCFRF